MENLRSSRLSVTVIGGGAFGGWTALQCLRRGADVTLIDAWSPGHMRASSGGVSRVIRHAYVSKTYQDLATTAWDLWQDECLRWQEPVLRKTGLLLMGTENGQETVATMTRNLQDADIPHETPTPAELTKRYPQLRTERIVNAVYEHDAGYLLASRACQLVARSFVAEGGRLIQASARPGRIENDRLDDVLLSSGDRQVADVYVFACGPWMPECFPDLFGSSLTVTRQEVFYFGTPPGSTLYSPPAFPVWGVLDDAFWYGIPANDVHGFKIADDTHGSVMEPTNAERTPSAEGLEAARRRVGEWFPELRHAPLLESRVCQYTSTTTNDFVIDRHPSAGNLWLVGGGSGHGFKHGPAVGELVADSVCAAKPPRPEFAVASLSR